MRAVSPDSSPTRVVTPPPPAPTEMVGTGLHTCPSVQSHKCSEPPYCPQRVALAPLPPHWAPELGRATEPWSGYDLLCCLPPPPWTSQLGVLWQPPSSPLGWGVADSGSSWTEEPAPPCLRVTGLLSHPPSPLHLGTLCNREGRQPREGVPGSPRPHYGRGCTPGCTHICSAERGVLLALHPCVP